MQQYLWQFFLILVLYLSSLSLVFAETGTVELNENSFHKIVDKFAATLIKFDVAYPFGDKHDTFVALAKEAKDLNDLLFAEVGIKDYGEKENEELAKKYGITKENLPAVKLFLKGKTEPITFDDKKEFTSDNLRRFVRDNSGIYLSLPGCIKSFDLLAIKFQNSLKEERIKILQEAENLLETITDKDADTGKIYITIMRKVLEKGDGFIENEIKRVNKLLSEKISSGKKNVLSLKINILQSFTFTSNNLKDEL